MLVVSSQGGFVSKGLQTRGDQHAVALVAKGRRGMVSKRARGEEGVTRKELMRGKKASGKRESLWQIANSHMNNANIA